MPLAAIKEKTFHLIGRATRLSGLGRKVTALVDTTHFSLRPFPRLSKSSSLKNHIIIYHRVLPKLDELAIGPVTSEMFHAQLNILKKNFRVIPLEQLIFENQKSSQSPVQSGAVSITFDDGYRDNYDHAFPILRNLNLPATIFLATDFIGTGKTPWHDKILHAFKKTTLNQFAYTPAKILSVPLNSDKLKAHAAFTLLEWLKQFQPESRDMHIAQVEKLLGFTEGTNERLMLNWDEVKIMDQQGISFGAHTQSHPILSTLNERDMENEIVGSQKIISQQLGKPVPLFAYPNGRRGDYNEMSKLILDRHEFAGSVTTNVGVNTTEQNRFELLRRQAWDKTADAFFCRLLLERWTTA